MSEKTTTYRVAIPLTWDRLLKQLALQQKRGIDKIIIDAIGEYAIKHSADDPDPALAEYEHIKRQWRQRPGGEDDEPTNES